MVKNLHYMVKLYYIVKKFHIVNYFLGFTILSIHCITNDHKNYLVKLSTLVIIVEVYNFKIKKSLPSQMFVAFFIVALDCLVEVRLNVLTREMLFIDSLRFALSMEGNTVDYNVNNTMIFPSK